MSRNKSSYSEALLRDLETDANIRNRVIVRLKVFEGHPSRFRLLFFSGGVCWLQQGEFEGEGAVSSRRTGVSDSGRTDRVLSLSSMIKILRLDELA